MNLANKLTMLRIALAMAMFVALISDGAKIHLLALFLFLAASITDWIDGYVARKTNTISAFGKVADPIADKILVLGALLALLRTRELGIPHWGVFLIIAREILIGGMRILISQQGTLPSAEKWGKIKTAVQIVAIALMILILVLKEYNVVPPWMIVLPYPLTILCVIVSWQSAYVYIKKSRRLLEKSWQ